MDEDGDKTDDDDDGDDGDDGEPGGKEDRDADAADDDCTSRAAITLSIEERFAWCPWCAIQPKLGSRSAPESNHPVATGSRTGLAGGLPGRPGELGARLPCRPRSECEDVVRQELVAESPSAVAGRGSTRRMRSDSEVAERVSEPERSETCGDAGCDIVLRFLLC